LWLHQPDELIASDIEKHDPQSASVSDDYRVGDNQSEAQSTFVKLASPFEVER
jgi:hypothetical protein